MSKTKDSILGEVADIIPGFAFKSSDFGETGELVVKIKDIEPPIINLNTAQRANLSKYSIDRLDKYKLRKGNFVIAMTGATIGKVGRLKEDKQAFLNQRVAKVEARQHLADDDFIYYCLCLDDFQTFIQNNVDSHSAQENISATSIGRYPIRLPLLSQQKSIASILSSLDDKIDLLHRQNATLEAMAQTLFRQWFVEEAKEETELGKVIETTSGGTPSRTRADFYVAGSISWVKSKELKGTFIFDTEEKITEEAILKSSAKILPENSILIAMYGATVGEFAIIPRKMACNQAICAVMPNENYPYTFLLMLVKRSKDELINMAVGSAQQNISQELIKQLSVPRPNVAISKFHKLMDPLFVRMKANIYQIQTLIALRDTLLPKLLSGEISIVVH